MKITVGKHVITVSAHNWTVNEQRTVEEGDNKGSVYLYPLGYYPSLRSLLTAMLDQKIASKAVSSVSEMLAAVKEAQSEIVEMTRTIDEQVKAGGGSEGTTESKRMGGTVQGENGMYYFPGRVLEIIPDLNVVERRKKGRGETVGVKLDGEAVEAVREAVNGKLADLDPVLTVTAKRVLEVIG